MANEAVLRVETLPPINFTVGNGSGIEKGTLLKLVDPMTASGGNIASGQAFAGISAVEKIANDGVSKLACYTDGIFDITASSGGTITTGQIVSMSGANFVKTATEAEIAAGGAVGKAMETTLASDATEVVRVFVGHI